MVVPGEVIAYLEMCREEGVNLQRGMNFGSSGRPSVVLMSRRPAHLTTTGLKMMVVSLSTKATTGHKSGAARTQRRSTNLSAGQGARLPRTDYFLQAASQHRELGTPAECVRVYEKMRTGIWTFNGTFRLVDGWREESHGRWYSSSGSRSIQIRCRSSTLGSRV